MIIKRSNDVTFTNQVKAQKLGICATEAKNNNPHDDHDSIPPDQILLELWNQHLLELAALCLLHLVLSRILSGRFNSPGHLPEVGQLFVCFEETVLLVQGRR
ncbi:hypothetical protein POM88_032685 [Heracleum sosnowskyi]|uniref:Uncharacterized protein n=1 Tax=Heracleum sosnowskyi TaxID=360622 RepID=A0AAD8HZS4_9APIA|nr:hypothetical protein POM88_032685 [Heracleum sosnowskyi]